MRFSTLRTLAHPRSKTAFSLLDQIFVSGTTFVTAVLVGRYCGSEELGQFALAITVLLFASGVQTNLISTPYTVFRVQHSLHRNSFAKTALGYATRLALVLLLTCVPVALAIVWIPSIGAHWMVGGALLIVLPSYLVREFARRFEFARLRMHNALRVDIVVTVLQLGLLGWLSVTGRLTASNALLCIGVACFLSGLVWYMLRRPAFASEQHAEKPELKREWNLGKWLLVDHLICFSQMYVMHWLLSILLSSSATGVLAACTTIASLANPFIQGTGNYLAPRFAETVGARSRSQTLALYWKSTAMLASVVAAFTAFIIFFGADILRVLYRDPAYSDQAIVLTILSFKLLCSIPTIAADHAITAMEAPKIGVASTIAGLIVTVACGVPLLLSYEVLGAALAILLGTIAEAFVLLGLFYQRLAVHPWDEPARPVARD